MELCLFLIIFSGYLLHQISSQNHSEVSDELYRKSIVNGPEVCAESGCVRGKYESGRLKPYDAFYGIPYAEPPVGNLRFENPVPYHRWSGYWDASYPREVCYQKNFNIPGQPIKGSDDCLYLNVYRPNSWSTDKKLPVMVYIHGGGFLHHSGNPDQFGPEYLMDNGEVILVTFNYRLSIFGFLCSGDEGVKGNFGLKDQQLALQWVVTNIESFGGDANCITLSGQSAGAYSVHFHMMNPISQALFHRVILMSGNALSPSMSPLDAASQFRLIAEFFGLRDWETAATTELAYEMKKIDAATLLSTVDQLFNYTQVPSLQLRPCIEGDWDDAFLTEDHRLVWAEGRFAQKPILTGTVADEGVFTYVPKNKTILDVFNKNIYEYLPIHMHFPPRYVFDVLKFYLGEKEIIDETNVNEYYKMYGDRIFINPFINFVNQYLKYADVEKNPIYLYKFAFESSFSTLQILGVEENLGVSHKDDLLYLFTQTSFFPVFEPDTPEGRMSDIYVRTIVNFVARGEVKVWRTFKPCTALTSTPFCDYQIFKRDTDVDPNQVIVSVSNEIDLEMVKLWSQIDKGN